MWISPFVQQSELRGDGGLFRPGVPVPALLLIALLLCVASPVRGHNFEFTDTLILLKADETFQVDLICDLDALALGVDPTAADDGELAAALEALSPAELEKEMADLERFFQRRIRVRFDGSRADGSPYQGEAADFEVRFPDRGSFLSRDAETPTHLGLTARLRGRIPEGATSFTLRASRAFPPVLLTILDQRRTTRILLERGVPSEPYALIEGEDEGEPSQSRWQVVGSYLKQGFWHILPHGLDHILFVLGLFLLAARWRPLLWQVSAFTAAHTLTLFLSTQGILRLSPAIVEPLIALSIAYVALENVFTDKLEPWRPALVFAFGLLHGLGFAGVLAELGLPDHELMTAVLAFNFGVELGQLAVLALAFVVVGAFRDRPWYRRRIVIPASILIALVGLYWAIERTFA